MAKPISPKEVVEKKASGIPDGVFEAFNELIAKNWDGHSAVLKQDEVMSLVCEKVGDGMGGSASRQMVFGNHWLDVEDIYRKAGWKVEYDKPGYNEAYEAYFKFSKKAKS